MASSIALAKWWWACGIAVVAGATAVAAGLAAGCGACTAASCADILNIELERDVWDDGLWQIDIETEDGASLSCEAAMPVASGRDITCDDERMALFMRGEGDGSGETAALSFYFNGMSHEHDDERPRPESVLITLWHEGDEVTSLAIEPTYEEVEANSGCGPICFSASERLSL